MVFRSTWYTIEDVTCKCGCGWSNVHPLLMHDLDACCDIVGQKLHLTSVCRCPEHNENEGGKSDSMHTWTAWRGQCYAADMWTGGLPATIEHDLLTFVLTRFSGVGLYLARSRPPGKRFIHGDKRPWAQRVLW
jgi:hypothetical protein